MRGGGGGGCHACHDVPGGDMLGTCLIHASGPEVPQWLIEAAKGRVRAHRWASGHAWDMLLGVRVPTFWFQKWNSASPAGFSFLIMGVRDTQHRVGNVSMERMVGKDASLRMHVA